VNDCSKGTTGYQVTPVRYDSWLERNGVKVDRNVYKGGRVR
jgi:hypothetical protein